MITLCELPLYLYLFFFDIRLFFSSSSNIFPHKYMFFIYVLWFVSSLLFLHILLLSLHYFILLKSLISLLQGTIPTKLKRVSSIGHKQWHARSNYAAKKVVFSILSWSCRSFHPSGFKKLFEARCRWKLRFLQYGIFSSEFADGN